MDEVKQGDTVRVTRTCSCGLDDKRLGTFHVAGTVTVETERTHYPGICNLKIKDRYVQLGSSKAFVPASWLAKVPPLKDLEKMTDPHDPVRKEKT